MYDLESLKIKAGNDEELIYQMQIAFKNQRDHHENSLTEANHQICCLRNDLSNATDKLNSYRDRCNDFENLIQEWEFEFRAHPSKECFKALEKTVEALRHENASLGTHYSVVRYETDDLKDTLDSLRSKLERAQVKETEANQKLNEALDEILKNAEVIAYTEQQLRDCKHELELKFNQVKQLDALLDEKKLVICGLKSELKIAEDINIKHQQSLNNIKVNNLGTELAQETQEQIYPSADCYKTASSLKDHLNILVGQFALDSFPPQEDTFYAAFEPISTRNLSQASLPSTPKSRKHICCPSSTSPVAKHLSHARIKSPPNHDYHENLCIARRLLTATHDRYDVNSHDIGHVNIITHTDYLASLAHSDNSYKVAYEIITKLNAEMISLKAVNEGLIVESEYCRKVACDSTLKLALARQHFDAQIYSQQLKCRVVNKKNEHLKAMIQDMDIKCMDKYTDVSTNILEKALSCTLDLLESS